RAKGGQVMIVVLAVVEHGTLLSRSEAIEGVHQGRFASAGTANHCNKFAWRNCDCDIVQQDSCLRAYLFETKRVDANTATFVVLGELGTGVDEFVGANTHFIAGIEL